MSSKYTAPLTEEQKAELINNFKLAFSEAAEQLMTGDNYGQGNILGDIDSGDDYNSDYVIHSETGE
jgi:hypothetical protein